MTGLGVERTTSGGTTPEDIQAIIAARYRNAGIVDGAEVHGTATMSYSITAGAVIIDTGADSAIEVPVAKQTIPTAAAPVTGSRVDTVYVKQNFPTADNPDNSVFVGVTSGALPANSYVLNKFQINAGVTATSAAPSVHNRKYAVPISGNLGRQHWHVETNGAPRTTGVFKRGAGKIFAPTDRDMELRLSSCVSASDAAGNSVDGTGTVLYKFYVDDAVVASFERPYQRAWETKLYSFIMAFAEGEHTVHYTVESRFVPSGQTGRWAVRHGGVDKFPGDDFRVYDKGVITW